MESKPFPLLSLPGELREQIFSHLVSPASALVVNEDESIQYKYNLSIFRVNKQIYTESHRVFSLLNVFTRIESPWEEAQDHVRIEGMVPVIAVGPKADNFPHIHLRCVIDAPNHGPGERELRNFVVLVGDLDKFCAMWVYSDLSYAGDLNPNLRLRLYLQNPIAPKSDEYVGLSKELQEKIMLPFAAIRGLFEVRVESQEHGVGIIPSVEAEMRERMAEPYLSAEECLEKAMKLMGEGDILANDQKFQLAIDRYIAAFAAMHIICVGRRRAVWADAWFERVLTKGPLKARHGHLVRMILRIQLVGGVVRAYSALSEWEEARFWGMRTINIVREQVGDQDSHADFPEPGQSALAWIFARTGIANIKLGDFSQTKQLFRAARAWDTAHDPVLGAVLTRMEQLSGGEVI